MDPEERIEKENEDYVDPWVVVGTLAVMGLLAAYALGWFSWL